MAALTQVTKKIRMDQWDIVKFQLLAYCYIQRIKVSELDLNCLTLLSILKETTITSFCDVALSHHVFGSTQSVRNAITKAEKKSLILKNGSNKKTISIHPSLKIQTEGNIMLDFKIYKIEPVTSPVIVA